MKIALLLPRSVIYPSISFDIMDGLKQAFKHIGLEGKHEIISAGIGVAAKHEEIYERCEQFLLDGADIIIGYLNPLSAEFVHSLFESSGKTLLVLDTGYHFPNFQGRLSNAYFISLQGCLCARVVVNKAFEDGYRKFAFTCSFYDAGYRPSYVYPAAVEEKGGEIVFNHITPLKRSDFTLAPLYNFLQEQKETAVLATFCGDMAEDFFRGSQNTISTHKLYVTGFTSDEAWLSKIPYPGTDFSSAVAWSYHLKIPQNKVFVSTMKSIKDGKANLFSLLGWEAALFIKNGNIHFDEVVIDSPRGKVWMNPENRFTEAQVYLATVTKDQSTGNCMLKDIEQASVTEYEREALKSNINFVQTIEANTWLNAYACLES
ncbi:ABC transporter substrate-binding protein [Chryseobacterium taihuense]|uniref:Branched-chain amino acid transport system substrate-binding protein n=1 Tax=Chryseobacterium taihuense TaxID=1141221 RepID=A0ABY0QXV7_9FLAO|nr:ABC transporter substrate-binding protein [Chryseobacterium taihuense]SDM09875.1 branched-chain amino acid transport system substrate-binding protein [Chryseobacterium taihuense]